MNGSWLPPEAASLMSELLCVSGAELSSCTPLILWFPSTSGFRSNHSTEVQEVWAACDGLPATLLPRTTLEHCFVYLRLLIFPTSPAVLVYPKSILSNHSDHHDASLDLALWELLGLTPEKPMEQPEASAWNSRHALNVDDSIMVKRKASASNRPRFGFQMDALLQWFTLPPLNVWLSGTLQCDFICRQGLYRCR